MASFNKVILVGNLTRDPEVRYTPSGTAVCDISLAVNSNWTDRKTNERKEEVTFIDVTLWGRTAEIAGEYLTKGRPVLIEGRLQQDRWDDKETGQKRSKLKVVADAMQLLGGRTEGGGGGGAPQGASGRPQNSRSAAPARDSYADADSGRTPDQTFYDDMPSGGEDVPF
ncbi:MAG: single-stranded DNA-binding protein [Planctomycetaceae bacterium]|nr:single-stranded DNA-binding protein [Planctomycetaceae bacterium]